MNKDQKRAEKKKLKAKERQAERRARQAAKLKPSRHRKFMTGGEYDD